MALPRVLRKKLRYTRTRRDERLVQTRVTPEHIRINFQEETRPAESVMTP